MTQRDNAPFLEMSGITKTFPGGVVANDDIHFEVAEGEVHGLLGENGAGKSTLMKILYGLYSPDSGDIYFRGDRLELSSPRDAIDAGIGMVHQHFMLIPRLSVLRNVILGRRENRFGRGGPLARFGPLRELAGLLSIDLSTPRERIEAIADDLGIDIDPEVDVWELTVGEQQRVEILKSLYWDVDLLVLDEPTAVLSPTEIEELFETLERLVDQGLTIVIITHKLDELRAITDRVTVLRDGEVVDTVETGSVTQSELAQMMVGRPVSFEVDRKRLSPGERALSVSGLHARDDRGLEAVKGVDLDIDQSEIVGIAGVSGNGQKELVECIVGVREPAAGTITVSGTQLAGGTRSFVDAGISYIPEDRLKFGCAPNLSVMENLIVKDHGKFTSRSGTIDYQAAREYAERLVEEFDIRVPNVDVAAGKLSGGNLQKLIIARELTRDPTLLVANQPTRGVDVGAIEYIQEMLLEQRKSGTGILLISEELDEVLQMSDRIVVMYEGEIVHRTTTDDVDRENISRMMTGGRETTDPPLIPSAQVEP
jgi:simple sugar transport system ATP-binding protein